MALELRARGIENWTTPRETADQIERLYRRTLISRGASDEILRFMLNPPIADRLSRHLPRSIDVVHKTGLIFDNAHDVGILYLPGDQPILVAAFVDGIGTDYSAAKLPIARIARILYEEATPPAEREPGRRRN
jgi:beta-lactamase class A